MRILLEMDVSISDNTVERLALNFIEGLGPLSWRKILSTLPSESLLFYEPISHLEKLKLIPPKALECLKNKEVLFKKAEKELRHLEKRNIRLLWYKDSLFPEKLNACADAPIVLFDKGQIEYNRELTLAIVGTRKAKRASLQFCEKIINELAKYVRLTIVSGLARGVDICAQRAAHQLGLQTIGVLGHGLSYVYPVEHKNDAQKFMQNGGLCTEFMYTTKASKFTFPKRNRIVAGLSDAVLVIESAPKGGSMITANLALSYNREVMAVPNFPSETPSGTNALIQSNRAHLVDSAQDVLRLLSIDDKKPIGTKHTAVPLTASQKKILECLNLAKKTHVDVVHLQTGIPTSDLSFELLQLELLGQINALPGNYYSI